MFRKKDNTEELIFFFCFQRRIIMRRTVTALTVTLVDAFPPKLFIVQLFQIFDVLKYDIIEVNKQFMLFQQSLLKAQYAWFPVLLVWQKALTSEKKKKKREKKKGKPLRFPV